MKIIALIPTKHIANYTDQEWLEAAFKYGIVYSESEYDRLLSTNRKYSIDVGGVRHLTVDSEFNVIAAKIK